MKVLFYTPTGLTSKQIGLCTEVLERLVSEGHDVRVVRCNAVLTNCFFNRVHNPIACASCQSRESKLLSLSGLPLACQTNLVYDKKIDSISLPEFHNLEELQAFTFEGHQVGRGAASSIISHFRDFHINSAAYGEVIESELRKSINVLRYFTDLIKAFEPDQIYLFNGRFSEVFPVLSLAQKLKIPFYSIEAGAKQNVHLFENSLPHSIISRTKTMNEIWGRMSPSERIEIAKEFFESKRYGDNTYEISYTKDQDPDALPDEYDPSKINVVIFNSSEDEVKTIDEWQHDYFDTQNNAIIQIAQKLASYPQVHFYLRVHPNLAVVKNQQVEGIKTFSFPNLTVIPATSKISSYKLLDVADKVISFGSTIGIEATYWKKPSILYGMSYYIHTGACYTPKSLHELSTLLLDKDLEPKDKSLTYPYAVFVTSYGSPTKHFNFGGLKNSTYKGKPIKKFYISFLPYLLKYAQYTKRWRHLFFLYFDRKISIKDILTYK